MNVIGTTQPITYLYGSVCSLHSRGRLAGIKCLIQGVPKVRQLKLQRCKKKNPCRNSKIALLVKFYVYLTPPKNHAIGEDYAVGKDYAHAHVCQMQVDTDVKNAANM